MAISPLITVVNRYVFMTLPFWIILAGYGIRALYQSKNLTLWILYFLALGLLLLRDPVSEDLIHYINSGQYLPLVFAAFVVLIAIVIVLQLIRVSAKLGQRGNLIKISIVCLIIFLHPLSTNMMYFEYQHGHRDNIIAATTFIAANRSNDDRVIAAIPSLVEYYLKQETEYIEDFFVNFESMDNQRIWLIQDYGVDQIMGNNFEDWVNQNCRLEGMWDNFTGGRNWKMRVFLCEI
jgi:hypothetical protein